MDREFEILLVRIALRFGKRIHIFGHRYSLTTNNDDLMKEIFKILNFKDPMPIKEINERYKELNTWEEKFVCMGIIWKKLA